MTLAAMHCTAAGYLCPLKANKFGIEFLKFQIKDYDSGRVVYEVQ